MAAIDPLGLRLLFSGQIEPRGDLLGSGPIEPRGERLESGTIDPRGLCWTAYSEVIEPLGFLSTKSLDVLDISAGHIEPRGLLSNSKFATLPLGLLEFSGIKECRGLRLTPTCVGASTPFSGSKDIREPLVGARLLLGLLLLYPMSGIKEFRGLNDESGIKECRGLRDTSGTKLFRGDLPESGIRLLRGLRLGSGAIEPRGLLQ